MKIKLKFDDELLKEYEARNSSPFFGICLQHDGQFYPSEDWMDFGSVILAWWMAAQFHLLGSGRCQKFLFMDGPYEVKVRHRRSSKMMELRPQGWDVVWKIPPYELTEVILSAAETVVEKLAQLETGSKEREVLERSVGKLRKITSDRVLVIPKLVVSSHR